VQVVQQRRAGDAARVEHRIVAHLLRQLGAGDDIGDRQPTTGLQYAEGLAEDLGLVRRQVDHAVGDDHVGGVVGHRQVLDFAQAKLDVRERALLGIGAGLADHGRRHVDADDRPVAPTSARSEKGIEAAAAAQIHHHFTRSKTGDRTRISASEAHVRTVRHGREIRGGIAEAGGDQRVDGDVVGDTAASRRLAAALARVAGLGHLGVTVPHLLADFIGVLLAHDRLPDRFAKAAMVSGIPKGGAIARAPWQRSSPRRAAMGRQFVGNRLDS
jgi:hypothetical protein